MIDAWLSMGRDQLGRALQAGHAIDPEALDNSEYRGISLGMPAFIDRLAWKTFMKAFHRDPHSGRLRGWNVRLKQTGIDGPVTPLLHKGEPKTFGHFAVVSAQDCGARLKVGHGLLLDYGKGNNPWFEGTRNLRDPLLAVHAGQVDLLIGWSYLQFGSLRMSTPSFFLLQRLGPLSRVVPAP